MFTNRARLMQCQITMAFCIYSKTCVKRPLSKRRKNGFQGQLPLNAGQKYCRMLQVEHSAILSTFIKLTVIQILFLSIFERPFYSGFYCTVEQMECMSSRRSGWGPVHWCWARKIYPRISLSETRLRRVSVEIIRV